jgi:hypothetical protein
MIRSLTKGIRHEVSRQNDKAVGPAGVTENRVGPTVESKFNICKEPGATKKLSR